MVDIFFLKCKKVRQVWRELLMEGTRMMLLEAPNPKLMMESMFMLPKDKQIMYFDVVLVECKE
jgi:hypothetical protein